MSVISGRVALGGLSLEFGNAQRRFDEVAKRVQALSEEQAQLFGQERTVIESLARIYLPELSPETVSGGLEALEERMREALEDQRVHRARLAAELDRTSRRVEELRGTVADSEAEEARVGERLDACRSAVEEYLDADEAYRAAVEEHRAVLERRSVLMERRARLQAAANVERPRYEAHRLFAYLHERRFGTPDYRGGPVARFLDGWLARRTGYEVLARNYRILRTGPHAIQAEVAKLTRRGTELEAVLDERQSAAGAACGLAAALAAEARSQERLTRDRGALVEATAQLDALAAEAREVEANRGTPWEEALELHREFLGGQTVQRLLEIARSTPDPRDDALVDELEKVRGRLDGLGTELGAHRKELNRLAHGTGSLADLARSAMEKFSSRRSAFSEEFRLGDLVTSLLDGHATTQDALGTMADTHVAKHILAPSRSGPWDGWFAELSSRIDRELGATRVERSEDAWSEEEVVVYDADGRVIQRRVKRSGEAPA